MDVRGVRVAEQTWTWAPTAVSGGGYWEADLSDEPRMSMYGALWRLLPGPAWLRVVLLAVLAALVVVVLFRWVFPALEPYMPFDEQTVVDTTPGATP